MSESLFGHGIEINIENSTECRVVSGTMASEHPPYQAVRQLDSVHGNKLIFKLIK